MAFVVAFKAQQADVVFEKPKLRVCAFGFDVVEVTCVYRLRQMASAMRAVVRTLIPDFIEQGCFAGFQGVWFLLV